MVSSMNKQIWKDCVKYVNSLPLDECRNLLVLKKWITLFENENIGVDIFRTYDKIYIESENKKRTNQYDIISYMDEKHFWISIIITSTKIIYSSYLNCIDVDEDDDLVIDINITEDELFQRNLIENISEMDMETINDLKTLYYKLESI